MPVVDADPKAQPELVFGLVGPLGTDLELVGAHLKGALAQVRYGCEVFRLSHFMREIMAEPWSKLRDGPEDEVIKTHIAGGNALRRRLRRKDAMAMLGIGALREHRENETGEATKPIAGFAAILRSLKRPEDTTVRLMRDSPPASG